MSLLTYTSAANGRIRRLNRNRITCKSQPYIKLVDIVKQTNDKEYSTELNDFNDFKSSLSTLEVTTRELTSDASMRQQRVDKKLSNLEEASTMLIEKLSKSGLYLMFIIRICYFNMYCLFTLYI